MNNDKPPPEVSICTHNGCWCVRCGSHYSPIRRGLYSDNVPASTVISEIKSILAHEGRGPVIVRWERS